MLKTCKIIQDRIIYHEINGNKLNNLVYFIVQKYPCSSYNKIPIRNL